MPLLETLTAQIAPEADVRDWLLRSWLVAPAADRRPAPRRAGRGRRRPPRPRAAVPRLAPGRVDRLGPPALPRVARRDWHWIAARGCVDDPGHAAKGW